MRIGIDIYSFDQPGKNSGVGPGVYVWNLIPKLFALGKNHEFVVFANRDNEHFIPKQANVKVVISPLPNRLRPLRILHEQLVLPWKAFTLKLAVVHSMGNNIPYLLSKKSILTVHDLMWSYYLKRGYIKMKYLYFLITVPVSLKKARFIITDSEFVKKEIIHQFKRSPHRTISIPLAGGSEVLMTHTEEDAFKLKYNYPFIFSVTTSLPHKNLEALLRAFFILKDKGIFDGKLVIAGQFKGGKEAFLKALIHGSGWGDYVVLAGFISEQEMACLYNRSTVFVYPSLYEGFGFPVLEAMKAGAPVVASNEASIPEVGGDACVYFNPHSVDDLVDKLRSVLSDADLRVSLVRKGRSRCEMFSWDATAMKTLSLYEELAQTN